MTTISTNHTTFQPLPQLTSEVKLCEESADILQRLKKINSGFFFCPDKTLVKKLKDVNPIELTKVLRCFFMDMVEKGEITDPVKFLDRMASVIPLGKLQEAAEVKDALEKAKEMFKDAKHHLKMTRGNTSPSFRAHLSSILDGIISVIESIINSFGIKDFFKPADSEIHADFKAQKIMVLLSLFGMITTMILPILGAATGGLIIGGTLLAIAALSAIWPFIKPKPSYLPANAENWTKQVQQGGFVAEGRKESLDEIANILKMNRHALLVGPSRVGKSLTAKAFVRAIERGDYPELKGKVVFRINTTDIIDQKASFLGGGSNILTQISEAMGRHRNDVILVLDEIHMACKNKEKIADQLKTFLDEGGAFPHVIGITTVEDYKHVKENNAFSQRFDRVDITSMQESETLNVLGDTLLRSPSRPPIKEGALEQIFKKATTDVNAPQPETSLRLLKRCINRTRDTQKSTREKDIIKKSSEIQSLYSQAAACRSRKKDVQQQIAVLEAQLRKLQNELSEEQKDLQKLYKSRNLLDRVTTETYASVIKISKMAQKKLNSKDEKQLNLFLLLHAFLDPSLESHIEAKAKALGVRAIIDKALIDEVAGG